MFSRYFYLVAVVSMTIAVMCSLRAAKAAEPKIKAGEKVMTIAQAPLMERSNVLLRVEPGKEFVISHVEGPWAAVTVQESDRKTTGWIHARYLARDECWKKVTTIYPAPLKVGDKTLLTIEPGKQFVPLNVKTPWVGVAVQQDGNEIRGWIEARYLTYDRSWSVYQRFTEDAESPEWAKRMSEIEKAIAGLRRRPARTYETRGDYPTIVQPWGGYNFYGPSWGR